MTTTDMSEIIFEEIESHLGPQMTFKKETDDSVTFTWGYGTLHQKDIARIVGVCAVYKLTFVIREREKCIDVQIDKEPS